MTSVVARTISTTILYLGVLFALTLLLAGHNEPGGGFVAGAMTAGMFSLLYIVFGREWVEARIRVDFRLVVALGLLVAVAFALLPLALGDPFLRSYLYVVEAPFLGEIKMSSAVGFDIGIYLTVVGAILAILRRSARGEVPG